MHMLIDFRIYIKFLNSLFWEWFSYFFLLQATSEIFVRFPLLAIKICLLRHKIWYSFAIARCAKFGTSSKPKSLFVFKTT
jgi:hypothetical protein